MTKIVVWFLFLIGVCFFSFSWFMGPKWWWPMMGYLGMRWSIASENVVNGSQNYNYKNLSWEFNAYWNKMWELKKQMWILRRRLWTVEDYQQAKQIWDEMWRIREQIWKLREKMRSLYW